MLSINRPYLRMICFVAATTILVPENATAEPVTPGGSRFHFPGGLRLYEAA